MKILSWLKILEVDMVRNVCGQSCGSKFDFISEMNRWNGVGQKWEWLF